MSASQGALFNECPLQWRFKYLDKVEPDRKTTYCATIFGSAFHSTLEEILVLDATHEEKIEDTSLVFLREFKKHFNKAKEDGYHIIVAGGDLDKAVKNYIYSAKIGVGKILNHELMKGYKKIFCESEYEYESEHFSIISKIDLVGFNNDEDYHIVDFKTGKHFSFKGIEKELQALFYIMVCYDKFKILPKAFKFLKYDRTSFSLKEIDINEPITEETIVHFQNATQKLNNEIVQSIETGKFRKHDATQKAQYCNWCNYKSQCKKVR